MNYQTPDPISIDFEALERSFKHVASVRSAWQRRVLLDRIAVYHGLTRSGFRQAFQLWSLEQTETGGEQL